MCNIVHYNMRTRQARVACVPIESIIEGGRSLACRIVAEEVPACCTPLGKENKLVFACGALADTLLSSSGRLSISAKSPLTGGIKESNAGGTTAQTMAFLNIRALVIEDVPENDVWQVLLVDAEGITAVPGDDLYGLSVSRKAELLRERYGNVAMALIGPAGERQMLAAGIANCDPQGEASRYCGRGGLGAVMGAKRIHAVVFRADRRTQTVYADRVLFQKTARAVSRCIFDNSAIFRRYGTAVVLDVTNALGALPVRNYSTGTLKKADLINGTALYDLIKARGGEGQTSHACMRGCLIQCSNVFPDASGKKLCSPIEYESLGLLGSNLDIIDLDAIARCNQACNDMGCDTIEVGAALGVVMESGIIPFGDANAALQAILDIGNGGSLGKLVGNGVVFAGKKLGMRRIPAARGQSFAAYDPRSMKGIGVTYATSPQGADHTAGNCLRGKTPHTSAHGQIEESRQAQHKSMILDSLGLCIFVGNVVSDWTVFCTLLQARHGFPVNLEDLQRLAEVSLKREHDFNLRAGLTEYDLPDFLREEPNPVNGERFDVAREELQNMWL